MILHLTILIQYLTVTDTHTQTHYDSIYRASIVSRGKNWEMWCIQW